MEHHNSSAKEKYQMVCCVARMLSLSTRGRVDMYFVQDSRKKNGIAYPSLIIRAIPFRGK